MKSGKLLFALLAILAAVSCFLVACSPSDTSLTEGEETGMYYFGYDEENFLLTLNSGNRFTLFIDGATKSGKYELSRSDLSLNFSDSNDGQISAKLSGDKIIFTYGDHTDMEFKKMVYFTVSFDSKGGSEVAAQSTLNGKAPVSPIEPTKDSFTFVGWYKDTDCTMPFSFETDVITEDTTLYAKWVEASALNTEYEIKFDLGYEGPNIEPQKTSGGKLGNAPTPKRENYIFGGWWISMYSQRDKLTTKFGADTIFNESTTLFALWRDAASSEKPLDLRVSQTSISWEGAVGAKYSLEITGDNEETISQEDLQQPLYAIDFSTMSAGDYVIKVTSSLGATETRYYRNKGLDRVSVFTISKENVLFFNEVKNAEKYYLTIECGDENHKEHENMIDLGQKTVYDFGGCTLGKDGIAFTVTAIADGFLSSTSERYIYKNQLAEVSNLKLSELDQILTWDAVPYATEYVVEVVCGNESHDHEKPFYTEERSFSLKECMPGQDGVIIVKVSARAKGFTSSEPSVYEYERVSIPAPSSIVVTRTDVSWDVVEDASGYAIRIANTSTTETIDVELSDNTSKEEGRFTYTGDGNFAGLFAGENVTLSVMAKNEDPAKASLWSDPIPVNVDTIENLEYYRGVISWKQVLSASSYEVTVGNKNYQSITTNSLPITFTEGGLIKITVKAYVGTAISESSIDVYVYTVSFNSMGGSSADTQYYAKGDELKLPEPTKENYIFAAWYNVANGGSIGGKNYSLMKFFEDDGDLTLYAYWNPKPITVALNFDEDEPNGVLNCQDEDGNLIKSTEVLYGENFTLPVPTPNNTIYTFGGWFTLGGGSGTKMTDELGNSLKPWTDNSITGLQALWLKAFDFELINSGDGAGTYRIKRNTYTSGGGGTDFDKLENIILPTTYNGKLITAIDGFAFKNATSLKTISIPDSITLIYEETVFTGCTSLEAINIYHVEGVDSPKYSSYEGLLYEHRETGDRLSFFPPAKEGHVNLKPGLSIIPYETFKQGRITSIFIPKSVTEISDSAFSECRRLQKVEFEYGGVADLIFKDRVFYYCDRLEEVIFPARLKTITPKIFENCSSLRSFVVEPGGANFSSDNGVMFDGKKRTLVLYPMGNARSSYNIPNGTTDIGSYAFWYARYLQSVTIPTTLITIDSHAFEFTKRLSDVIFDNRENSNLRFIKEYAFNCGDSVANFTVRTLDLPSKYLEEIGDFAFNGCVKMYGTISFGNNFKKIGASAFRRCFGITMVSLPLSLESIGDNAFAYCTQLVRFTYAGKLSDWNKVSRGAGWLDNVPNTVQMTLSDGSTIYRDQMLK